MTETDDQREVCARFGAEPSPPAPQEKAGLARNVRPGIYPLHGLRHPPERGTSGWYLWTGDPELPDDPGFFEPVHVAHLNARCPEAGSYLALPPGWRFLIAPDYEDVWFDPTISEV